MGTRAGIYVRISQDRGGAGLGVQRQEQDCRALCERRGWDVVDVYVDDDVSAYSGKPRPAWRRLLADIDAGGITGIVCWHVDRLTRTPRELEDVISHAEQRGLELATVSGDVDLATPTGRMVARMLGAAARHESEHKAERQRRERRQAAERGAIAGGGMHPYGYRRVLEEYGPRRADGTRARRVVRDELDDDQAAVIREAARRVLAGESLSSVCRDFASRDISTPYGGRLTPTKLRRILASARISGRREHTPRDTYKGTRPLLGEIVATAAWPAIISVEDSDRLRAILSRPDRRPAQPANGRTYLLSGLLRCALCGAGMTGRPKAGTPRYVCPNMPGGHSCGRMATIAARTDEHVRDLVVAALASPQLQRRLTRRDGIDPELAASIAKLENQQDELARSWGEGLITRAEWLTARDALERRLATARDALARQSQTTPLDGFLGSVDHMMQRWETMNTAQRRAVVGAVVDCIKVSTADPRRKWDPQRFEVTWRA
jgi:DNA invertase Pin-like site-specific DNA recombinase